MIRSSATNKKKFLRRDKRHNIPFQRVAAKIQLNSSAIVLDSRVFLNDLSAQGVGCFCNSALDRGEKISIVIEQPRNLFVRGEVIWCSPYTMDTKVIRQDDYKYRVGIRFIFETKEEADAVQNYCNDLYNGNMEKSHLKLVPPISAGANPAPATTSPSPNAVGTPSSDPTKK